MNDLLRRKAATEATLNRYRGKAFDWRTGITCVHLARCQLRKMGHSPPSLPRFRSLLAAKQALAERGWGTTEDMLEEILPAARIAPARMLLGDLAVLPDGEDAEGNPIVELGSIVVCVGRSKLMGWREDVPELVMLDVSMDELAGAWRL